MESVLSMKANRNYSVGDKTKSCKSFKSREIRIVQTCKELRKKKEVPNKNVIRSKPLIEDEICLQLLRNRLSFSGKRSRNCEATTVFYGPFKKEIPQYWGKLFSIPRK